MYVSENLSLKLKFDEYKQILIIIINIRGIQKYNIKIDSIIERNRKMDVFTYLRFSGRTKEKGSRVNPAQDRVQGLYGAM